MLTLDASHVYRFGTRIVPGVTSVLAPYSRFVDIPPERLDVARQKGMAIHAMVQMDCEGDLDYEQLPTWLQSVYSEWRRFRETTCFVARSNEEQVYHPRFGYAGTLDMTGACEFKHARHSRLTGPGLIDIKRTLLGGPTIALQTAAYFEAKNQALPPSERLQWRAALRLNEQQRFYLDFHDDAGDFGVFLAALSLHRWKEKHDRHANTRNAAAYA